MDVALLITTLCYVRFAAPLQFRPVKRIVDGFPLKSHEDYGTYHYIALRKMWGCVSDQALHEVGSCIETPHCGGTLFHPEFVITAAHCADYKDYYLRKTSDIYDPQSIFILDDQEGGLLCDGRLNRDDAEEKNTSRVCENCGGTTQDFFNECGIFLQTKSHVLNTVDPPADGLHIQSSCGTPSANCLPWQSGETSRAWRTRSTQLQRNAQYNHRLTANNVNEQVLSPRQKHQFYSNIALLAGSVDYFGSEQKRHSYKVFPHPEYAGAHDVALLQTCEPFIIEGNVRIAPVVPLTYLTTQFASIVTKSTACLYIGFGNTDDPSTKFRLETGRLVSTEYIRYTWRKVSCPATTSSCRPTSSCHLCSEPIPPRLGGVSHGDSGGPIVCDGYYVAVIVSGRHIRAMNVSRSSGYALYCIKDAITPERLEYYKGIPPRSQQGEKQYFLDPVHAGRQKPRH